MDAIRLPGWPARAWVAVLPTGDDRQRRVRVLHGPAVEVRAADGWFAEAIWPGDFGSGDFDRHEVVFGSGGRVRGDTVRFVSSSSMLDRLHHLSVAGQAFVSNSLPAILAASGARMDPLDPHGYQRFHTQRLGPGRYVPTVPTDRGELGLTYIKHVVWDGTRVVEEARPEDVLDFSDFTAYYGYLLSTMQALATNLGDPRRTAPLRWLGTLSNGYDSTTATVLGRSVGLERAVSFIEPHVRSEAAIREVAGALGIEVELTSRSAFKDRPFPEVPFLASGSYGYEMQFKGVEQELAGTVLLTGYYGDRMWGLDLAPMAPMARTSQSGISLTEYRLHANFVHLPVPFIGARGVADVLALSRSAEMAPWRLDNGYDRPVPRRIVESAGVPRESFAFGKLMSSMTPRNRGGFTPASQEDFQRFLRRHGAGGLIARARYVDAVRTGITWLGGRLKAMDDKRGAPSESQTRFFKRLKAYGREPYLFKYSLGWALERAVTAYEAGLPTADAAPPAAHGPH